MADTTIDTPASGRLKRRHPWLAALLSSFVMGLGQLYNGRLRAAMLWFAAEFLGMVIFIAALAAGLAYTFEGFLILLIVGGLWALGGRLFAMVKAYVAARQAGIIALRPWNRWYVYAVITILPRLWAELPRLYLTSWHIPSGAMQPSLRIGDRLEAQAGAYRDRLPERGEIVIFRVPNDPETSYIKRVVGLPGDSIQMLGGILHIDDVPVGRESLGKFEWVGWDGTKYEGYLYREEFPSGTSHTILEEGDDLPFDNTPPYSVPTDHVFVLGDNRDNALDSRIIDKVASFPCQC